MLGNNVFLLLDHFKHYIIVSFFKYIESPVICNRSLEQMCNEIFLANPHLQNLEEGGKDEDKEKEDNDSDKW